jgi:hypothetical protein
MDDPPDNAALAKYYQGDYWGSHEKDHVRVDGAIHQVFHDRASAQIAFVAAHMETERAQSSLEIGAGSAAATLAFRKRADSNVVSHVCEPGEQWLDIYKQNNIHVAGRFFPFEPKIQYDYVHASHWLEHMRDIPETLRTLRSMMASDGHIFIEVPNTAAPYWERAGRDTPHIHFFTLRSLRSFFEAHGFECVSEGLCGITFDQSRAGVPVASDFGMNENGVGIRALFRRVAD